MKYIGFRERAMECAKKGIRKEIRNPYPWPPSTILLCTKYLEVCGSGVCRAERMGEESIMTNIKLRCECGHEGNFIQEDSYVKFEVNNCGEKIKPINCDKETRYFCPKCNEEVSDYFQSPCESKEKV